MKKVFFYFFILISANSIAAPSSAPNIKITGVYSSLSLNEESGDVLGIEVVISETFSGKYFVIFQSSEGQPRKPVVADVKIRGETVVFEINEESGYKGTFQGVINSHGLTGTFLEGQLSPEGKKQIVLPRKNSFWSRY